MAARYEKIQNNFYTNSTSYTQTIKNSTCTICYRFVVQFVFLTGILTNVLTNLATHNYNFDDSQLLYD